MLHIETHGPWREMGRQIGEEFRDRFPELLEHFAGWLVSDLDGFRPAVGRLREVVRRHCPELDEETAGMAEATGIEPDVMLGYRFFNEIRNYREEGCTGAFLADADEGPLLARTCDIEPDVSAEIQLCRVNRPDEGARTINVTYLGLTGGVGLNEHGIGLTGSSASTNAVAAGEGLPTALMNHMVMSRCRSLDDVRELLGRHTMRCKGAVELACDAQGDSMLIELASGYKPVIVPRREDRSWQVCSNFFPSGRIPALRRPPYLQSAYARYGRLVHQLDWGLAEHSVPGLKALFEDIAQPGLVAPEEYCWIHTAYAFVVELKARRMHLCPGHPSREKYIEVSL